jgi:hypothetical protein
MRPVLLLSMVCCVVCLSTDSSIVQFLVFADHQSDVVSAFPGASVDYTWNNVFVVTMWTENPARAIPMIQATLDASPTLKVLVQPCTLDTATQKWLQYNLLWVLILILTFMGGCVCGATMVNSYKNASGRRVKCPAEF